MIKLAKKLLLIFSARDRVKLIFIFILIVTGVIAEAFGIAIILPFINLITDPGIIQSPGIIRTVYDWLGFSSFGQFAIWASVFLLSIFVFKNVFLFISTYVQNKFVFSRQASIMRGLLKSYLYEPYTFHLQKNSAELLRNVSLVALAITGVLIPLFLLLSEILVMITILAMLFYVDKVSALVVFLVLGGFSTLYYKLLGNRLEGLGKRQQKHNIDYIKWINQGLSGIKEIQLLNRQEFFVDQFFSASSQYARISVIVNSISQFPRGFIEIIAVLGMILIIIVNILQSQNVQLAIPVLAVFAMAAIRIMPSINRILMSLTSIRFNLPSVDIIYEDLVELKQKRLDDLSTHHPEQDLEFINKIEAKDIRFIYPNTTNEIIKGISFTIPKGDSIAFIGTTGAGKTTLVDILLGLLRLTDGAIYVDGKNIYDNIAGWQQKIGYVPQSIYLMDDSILNNIALGIPEEMIIEEQIWNVLEVAQLDEFVRSLPEGLKTMVGEQGVRLSGGQRQRIGIARALYHDPKILVMDEATSSLDNETEKYVSEAIDNISGQKTLIIIAHRLSTIKKCNVIYKLENGKIVVQGKGEGIHE